MRFSPRVQLMLCGGVSTLLYAGVTLLSRQFVYGEGHRQRPILAFLALFGLPRALAGIGVVIAILVVGYFPFLAAGTGLWRGTVTFAEEWQTNSFLFPLLRVLVGDRWQANLLVIMGLGGVLMALLRWNDRTDDRAFLWSLFVALGALFLSSPVGNPWYFLWITPFLCVSCAVVVVALRLVGAVLFLVLFHVSPDDGNFSLGRMVRISTLLQSAALGMA